MVSGQHVGQCRCSPETRVKMLNRTKPIPASADLSLDWEWMVIQGLTTTYIHSN